MEIGKSEGTYTVEQMQKMATVAQTANGLEIKGNNFKVTSLIGCPDMVLFSCERIKELEQELIQTQIVVTKIQDLNNEVSEFVENLDYTTLNVDESKALNGCLEIGSKIRNLELPEFILK